MLSKNQRSMFLKTQMLCIIANDALMPYVLKVIDFRRHRLKLKEIEIWNLSNEILSKLNFLIDCFRCCFNWAKLVNETIISNREVFNYGYIDSTNGKSIINFMISKNKRKHH